MEGSEKSMQPINEALRLRNSKSVQYVVVTAEGGSVFKEREKTHKGGTATIDTDGDKPVGLSTS